MNPWGDEPPPLILTESKGTAAALRPLAGDYLCPVAGLKGHTTGFLRTVVAAHLRDDEKPRRVIYLGDLDKSGYDIEANALGVLADVAGLREWHRLAMTEHLADERDISPIWKIDGRNAAGHWAIEVESLGQPELVDLLRGHLDGLLPGPLADVRERERRERDAVRARLEDR